MLATTALASAMVAAAAAGERGREIFEQGTGVEARLRGDTLVLAPTAARCINCHSRNEVAPPSRSANRPLNAQAGAADKPPVRAAADRAPVRAAAQPAPVLPERARVLASEQAPVRGSEQAPVLASERAPVLASERAPVLASERALALASERALALASERAPTLDAASLLEPKRRRNAPPSRFDEASFCRLLATGIDAADVMVRRSMPVYVMARDDCAAVWRFLVAGSDRP